MQQHHLVNLVAYCKDRVKRCHRLLKDHAHLPSAELVHIINRHFGNIVDDFFLFINAYSVGIFKVLGLHNRIALPV